MFKNTFIEKVSTYLQTYPLDQKEFMERVITLNNQVRERVEKGDCEYFRSRGIDWKDNIFKQRFETCKKDCDGFCLGIFRKHGWIEMVFEERDDVVHSLNKKQKIPHTLKTLLWESTFPNKYNGKCAICERSNITARDFEAGHIIAEKNGGEIRLDNLRPICSACNKSQGTRDMSEVINQIRTVKTWT
jgi:5-methylcytosine-specific restriction endonuclease McrA